MNTLEKIIITLAAAGTVTSCQPKKQLSEQEVLNEKIYKQTIYTSTKAVRDVKGRITIVKLYDIDGDKKTDYVENTKTKEMTSIANYEGHAEYIKDIEYEFEKR